MLNVSVIATVLNECHAVIRLLDSLAVQSRPPDQIVIVDGGSQDGTFQLLQQRAAAGDLPLSVHLRPGCNISQGRNAAVSATDGEIIAATDAGVELPIDWLNALVLPFEQDPDTQVVSGFFVAAPETLFEIAMGATVLPALEDIDPQTFLPSSRSIAFRKSAWQVVGGYPEWLDYCEDLVFDLRLSRQFGRFVFAPDAAVRFRPRSTLAAFFRQYYRYARGDGKADLWRRRHAVRYLTYCIVGPVLLLLGVTHSLWWLLGIALGMALYTASPYRRLDRLLSGRVWHEKVRAAAWVPVIRVVGDVAKMVGYPVGWLWRLRHASEARW